MKITPNVLKFGLNLYPSYLGAGVKVTHISKDRRELHVSMSLRRFNRNAVGTHFGGSIYSMLDPHLMLLLIQLLGNDYWVWDKSAHIDFIKASKQNVTSIINQRPPAERDPGPFEEPSSYLQLCWWSLMDRSICMDSR
jgi:hypothetical protein